MKIIPDIIPFAIIENYIELADNGRFNMNLTFPSFIQTFLNNT
jgi:hypothetical protein